MKSIFPNQETLLRRSKWWVKKGKRYTVTVGALIWGVITTILILITDIITGDPWPIYKFPVMLIIGSVIGIVMGYAIWITAKRTINSAQDNQIAD